MQNRFIPSGNSRWDTASARIHFASFAFVIIVLSLIAFATGGCSSKSDDLAPIPNCLNVDGVVQEVRMRHWCDTDAPCELLPQQDVYWEVQPDGRVKIMRLEKELRFERGEFMENRVSGTGGWFWIPNSEGGYLLATDGANRAYIIYYPLPEGNPED